MIHKKSYNTAKTRKNGAIITLLAKGIELNISNSIREVKFHFK